MTNGLILRLWRDVDSMEDIFRAEFETDSGNTLSFDLPAETWGEMLDRFAEFTYRSQSSYAEHRFDLLEAEDDE